MTSCCPPSCPLAPMPNTLHAKEKVVKQTSIHLDQPGFSFVSNNYKGQMCPVGGQTLEWDENLLIKNEVKFNVSLNHKTKQIFLSYDKEIFLWLHTFSLVFNIQTWNNIILLIIECLDSCFFYFLQSKSSLFWPCDVILHIFSLHFKSSCRSS